MNITEYKPSEVIHVLTEAMIANDTLIKNDKDSVTLSIIGKHGEGKTTTVREVCENLNKNYYVLNLAQITEPAELIGYYSKEFKLCKEEDCMWVNENLLSKYVEEGWKPTNEIRTVSCPPDWVHSLEDHGVLILDDFSRGNTLLMQAVMEICQERKMIGWNLADKFIQVLLTENPEEEYNTTSLDAAASDRFLRIHYKWDAHDWADRAEKIGTDPRLINFVIWMPELLEKKQEDGISASGITSPRMMDKFFSLVSTIDSFDKNLDIISMFGNISVGQEFTNNFVNFINKKLDKLPSVQNLLFEVDESEAKRQLTIACGDYNSPNWNSAIAAILATRMVNFTKHYEKDFDKGMIEKYKNLILHESFGVDQKYLMVSRAMSLSNKFTNILMSDVDIVKYLTT